ncbi:MAG TPA: aldo/keto reductase [Epsilonproteobacteria bacterium]|nr:aldo/keto reductase [Campylobacterota bacterium]
MLDTINASTLQSIEMPKIIYGTAWKKEKTTELVVQAVKEGFSAIDTACQPKHYAEALVGEALRELDCMGIKRDTLFIQTKFTPLSGQAPNAIPYDEHASLKEQVFQSFQTSKKNLQTRYIDAWLLHSPLFPFKELMTAWHAMEERYLRQEVLQLGISNCYDLNLLKRLYEEADVKPSIVQNRFYRESDYDSELRAWCKTHQIRYQSFWSLTANPNLLGSRTIIKLAQKYDKNEAQILFAYLVSQGIAPLSGTTSQVHMREDLEAVELKLEKGEIASITSLVESSISYSQKPF